MKSNQSLVFLAVLSSLLVANGWLHASEIDDRIESTARNSYVFKTMLKDDSIITVSKDANVILMGTISDENQKILAGKYMESLNGVLSVDNQLHAKGESPAEYSDAWLADRIKFTLMIHRQVSKTKITMSVNGGVVCLRGEVLSQAQKEFTGEYAKNVDGVKNVNNKLSIATSVSDGDKAMNEQIDDASTSAMVKTALWINHSPNALKAGLETMDGNVAITGTANNQAEKNLITLLVTGIYGVKTVINSMVTETVASEHAFHLSPPQNLRIVSK